MRSDMPENIEQRFWCVENFSLADVLSEAERDELHHYMQFVQYRKGETIFFPGDPSNAVYSLHDGNVRLAHLDDTGRRLTLTIVGRGQLFGETSLSGEQTRQWIAEAMEDTTLCIISKQDLLRFAEKNGKLALHLNKAIGERLTEISNKMENLLFRTVPSRLARLLLELAKRFGKPEADGIHIALRLTHQDIANLIGTTRETTSLTLGNLERQGLIRKKRQHIVILDKAGLEAMD